MRQRIFIAIVTTIIAAGCLVLMAQEPPAQNPPGRGAAAGPAGGRGNRGPGGGGSRSPDGFSQFIRPLAPQDVLIRGQSLYDANCASCHAPDMRGVAGKGNNLLRSAVAMDDEHGDLIGDNLIKHKPPVNLPQADVTAASEYIHSVLATMGSQGSPPGRNPVGLKLNVLVGDAQAGKVYFDSHCASCHSVAGDLKDIGARYPDPRNLQNAWVAGLPFSGNPFAGRGAGGRGGHATIIMANGQKIEGTLVREDDFLVVLTLADGTRRVFPIENGVSKVEVADPQAAHKKMVLDMDDPQNKNMHDITAYLATLK